MRIACGTRLIHQTLASMLRLGFFQKFKGNDTVLLCGDREDISMLRAKLAFLSKADTGCSVAIHELCSVSSSNPVELFAISPSSQSSGSTFSFDDSVSERLSVLEQGPPGHQYFDLANQRTLMVSAGEYDDNFWRTRGQEPLG